MLEKNVPEYYPTMYQDGYTPSEILTAARKKLLQMRQEQTEYPQNIHIFEVILCGTTA